MTMSSTATAPAAAVATSEELLAVADELLPLLAANAASADADRTIARENIDALRKSGLLRAPLASYDGGPGASWESFIDVVVRLSSACPSTGWVYAMLASSSWMTSILPASLREEILAKDDHPLIVGSITPTGTVEKVEGGYLVNGRWAYATGAYFRNWSFGAVLMKQPDGSMVPGFNVLLREDQTQIEDTWFVTGMRGTGSITLIADNVFVDDDHVLPADFAAARPPAERRGAADWYPFIILLGTTMSAVAVGAAQGLLAKTVEDSGTRNIHYSRYAPLAISQVAQREIGQAAAQINAAEVILSDATRLLDGAAQAPRDLGDAERGRIRGGQSLINELTRAAADTLMTVYGTSAFSQPHLLERHWRDINVITRHGVVNTNSGFEAFGQVLVGQPVNLIPGFL